MRKRPIIELGAFYHSQGRFSEAIEEHHKVLAIDPRFGWALNDLAYVYADSGDFDKALEHFQKYAAVSPGDPNPLDSIAELSLRKGDLDEALRKYEEVLEIRPDFILSLQSVAFLHALMENYAEAAKRIEEVPIRAATAAAKLDFHLSKAYLNFWLGNTDRALVELKAHGELASTLGAGLNLAANAFLEGCILQQRGQFEPAEEAYKRWADYWSESGILTRDEKAMMVVAHTLVLGLLDVSRGEVESARTKLAQYVPPIGRARLDFIGEWNAQAARCLEGEVLLAEEKPAEAVRALATAAGFNFQGITRVIDLVYYHLPVEKDVLARAYKATGETDKAIAEYKRLMTIDRTNQVRQMIPPIYHFRLAGLYEDKGLRDKARGEYQEFLDLWKDADPGRPEVEEAKKRFAGLAGR